MRRRLGNIDTVRVVVNVGVLLFRRDRHTYWLMSLSPLHMEGSGDRPLAPRDGRRRRRRRKDQTDGRTDGRATRGDMNEHPRPPVSSSLTAKPPTREGRVVDTSDGPPRSDDILIANVTLFWTLVHPEIYTHGLKVGTYIHTE